MLWDIQQAEEGVWDTVKNRGGANLVVFQLATGRHTFVTSSKKYLLTDLGLPGFLVYLPVLPVRLIVFFWITFPESN